jgi:glycosyltransferase involved in cell wall biosynthesis
MVKRENGQSMPERFSLPDGFLWCALPVYNNRETLYRVAAECRAIVPHVVVVDDGSTDTDVRGLLAGLDVTVLVHSVNRGKGEAIRTASRYVEEQGGVYMVTVDTDGQHLPADISKFIPAMQDDDPAIIVGCRNFNTDNVPFSSRFGRSFANFWLLVETGLQIADCQSGFRAYPVRYLNKLKLNGEHYDFEAEVLARAAWAGLSLKMVAIDVVYPKPEERVSSFRPLLDNFRLTHSHAMLVLRRLLPLPHKKLVVKNHEAMSLLRHPGKVLRKLLKENATPEGLALSAAVGLFIAVLPIFFLHTAVILYFSQRLGLNKIVSLNIQHLAMPPFIPALCIELGYYMRNGVWLTDLSFATVFREFSSRLYEWFLGSLVIAPLATVMVWIVIYLTASFIKNIRCRNVPTEGC